MHLSIILDPRADVLHAGKRGGNGRVVPPPAHGCCAGGGEGAQAQRCGGGRHTSGAGRARHTARHRRDAAHAAAARRHASLSRRENPLRPHRRLEHVLSGGEAGIEKSVKVRRLDDEKASGKFFPEAFCE